MSEVDWSTVKTERQQEEAAILQSAELLDARVQNLVEEVEHLTDAPGELTPILVVDSLKDLAGSLAELVSLFHSHLTTVDLDDTTKSIGVSGGEFSSVVTSHGEYLWAEVHEARVQLKAQGKPAWTADVMAYLEARRGPR